MKTEKVPLESVNVEGDREVTPDSFVLMPFCDSPADPPEATAELWIGDQLVHSLAMERMTAQINGRLVYAPASEMARASPGSQLEHTANIAVNRYVLSGDGPIDQKWHSQ